MRESKKIRQGINQEPTHDKCEDACSGTKDKLSSNSQKFPTEKIEQLETNGHEKDPGKVHTQKRVSFGVDR